MSRKPTKKQRPAVRIAQPPPVLPPTPALPPAPARPLMTDLMEAMTLRATEAGRGEAARTQQQTILHKLIQDAAAGDTRAAQILIALKREGDAETQSVPNAQEYSAEDEAVLANFAQQLAERRATEEGEAT